MRLYSLDKRNFLLVFMAFFACFALGIFIGLAGPEITLTREFDAATLTNGSQEDFLANGPFIIQTQLLGSYSRQFWLFARYKIVNTESKTKERICADKVHHSTSLMIFQMKFLIQHLK